MFHSLCFIRTAGVRDKVSILSSFCLKFRFTSIVSELKLTQTGIIDITRGNNKEIIRYVYQIYWGKYI
ncbi:hypothetical protein MsAg5_11640 [Methanosarcinaceae archaeon Ag5]|uniref:Uncharacterized protein n=1 Tax=Methanolapillus africanus TaxID=3028297 RepID=A0AAE4MIP6_9EURY|nr:hypothetical protein [Methanosarcinaceae archaeon Ag5]